jgi:hypothetical protein
MHHRRRRGIVRRFEQDHLVAADAGVAIGERAGRRRVERECPATGVEHDKIVAETMHFQERDAAHAPLIWRGPPACPTPPRCGAGLVRAE